MTISTQAKKVNEWSAELAALQFSQALTIVEESQIGKSVVAAERIKAAATLAQVIATNFQTVNRPTTT